MLALHRALVNGSEYPQSIHLLTVETQSARITMLVLPLNLRWQCVRNDGSNTSSLLHPGNQLGVSMHQVYTLSPLSPASPL
jgi:hypothetical protein